MTGVRTSRFIGWRLQVAGPPGCSPIQIGEDVPSQVDAVVGGLAREIMSIWPYTEIQRIGMAAKVMVGGTKSSVIRDLAKKPPRVVREHLHFLVNAYRAGPGREACLAALDTINKAEEDRNSLAHSLWALCPSRPDALVLIEPEFLIRYHIEGARAEESVAHLPIKVALRKYPPLMPEDVTVHTRDTLGVMRARAVAASKVAVPLLFWFGLEGDTSREAESQRAHLLRQMRTEVQSRHDETPRASPSPPPSALPPPKS